MSYHSTKEKTVIGFLLPLPTEINLKCVQKAQPFALGVQKAAPGEQIGGALWDNHATAWLAAVKAKYVFKPSNSG